jgi:hypothetical protein
VNANFKIDVLSKIERMQKHVIKSKTICKTKCKTICKKNGSKKEMEKKRVLKMEKKWVLKMGQKWINPTMTTRNSDVIPRSVSLALWPLGPDFFCGKEYVVL